MKLHQDVMVESIAKEVPDATVRAPNGGYFLWAELPPGIGRRTGHEAVGMAWRCVPDVSVFRKLTQVIICVLRTATRVQMRFVRGFGGWGLPTGHCEAASGVANGV